MQLKTHQPIIAWSNIYEMSKNEAQKFRSKQDDDAGRTWSNSQAFGGFFENTHNLDSSKEG